MDKNIYAAIAMALFEHQGNNVGCVVAHTRGKQSVVFHSKGQGSSVRKYHIRMCHNAQNGSSIHAQRQHHIFCFINGDRISTVLHQPVLDKECPLRFAMGRGGNGSKGFKQVKMFRKL